jgi:DNA-directed RNA polymerase subunit RPC12/RpoP
VPNHYDIDVYCRKCGRYIYTIYPNDEFEDGAELCDKCKSKRTVKERRSRRKLKQQYDV